MTAMTNEGSASMAMAQVETMTIEVIRSWLEARRRIVVESINSLLGKDGGTHREKLKKKHETIRTFPALSLPRGVVLAHTSG